MSHIFPPGNPHLSRTEKVLSAIFQVRSQPKTGEVRLSWAKFGCISPTKMVDLPDLMIPMYIYPIATFLDLQFVDSGKTTHVMVH